MAAHGADMPRPRRAVADDLALAVRFLPDGGMISAGEPVIAALDITNRSREAVEVLLGSNEVPAAHIALCDHEGRCVAQTPRADKRPDGLCGLKALEPDATYTTYWVITALHSLDAPGLYELRATLVNWMNWTVLCEARAELRVDAFDAERLDARCDQIYRSTDLPPAVRWKAICSVRHDIALPYLDAMATAHGGTGACLAMRRIGTARAEALLEALASRDDRVGEAARKAREMDLETSIWDVLVW